MPDLNGIRGCWRLRDGAGPVGGSLLESFLQARGIPAAHRRSFLSPQVSDLRPASELPGARAAARVILAACDAGLGIELFGDYDVDGTCAIAIMVHTLRLLRPGADLKYTIPHRLEGYGLSVEGIDTMHARRGGTPGLLVTVDCGVTAREALARAAELGWQCVVIDHHEVAREGLPTDSTQAIVHWDIDGLSDEVRSATALCAGALAWKVACCLVQAELGGSATPESRRLLSDLLSYAAMATVADVMPLVGENRTITSLGLRQLVMATLPATRAIVRHGAGLVSGKQLDSMTVAYKIAPALNAVGRLGYAQEVADFLCLEGAQDGAAERAAADLRRFQKFNEERKLVERGATTAALAMARGQVSQEQDERRGGLCLFHEDWHPGIVGVVAGRVAEVLGRPTMVLALDRNRGIYRGSARSQGLVNLAEMIDQCRAVITTGGGHAAAGGVTVAVDRIEEFARTFRAACAEAMVGSSGPEPRPLDGELRVADATRRAVDDLYRAGHFGHGFREPVYLCRDCTVTEIRQQNANSLGVYLSQREEAGPLQPPQRAVVWSADELSAQIRVGARLDLIISVKPGIKDYVDAVIHDVIMGPN
ncbi:MAG: DHHA1 domain-containing protein [Planctomycetota bacterium]|nr:DHHA1 domain-containing protein [Planctomycetota bacterium]MDA1105618.1 DHHA1 domain-containing protein [Planctomycetota bacterium]